MKHKGKQLWEFLFWPLFSDPLATYLFSPRSTAAQSTIFLWYTWLFQTLALFFCTYQCLFTCKYQLSKDRSYTARSYGLWWLFHFEPGYLLLIDSSSIRQHTSKATANYMFCGHMAFSLLVVLPMIIFTKSAPSGTCYEDWSTADHKEATRQCWLRCSTLSVSSLLVQHKLESESNCSLPSDAALSHPNQKENCQNPC